MKTKFCSSLWKRRFLSNFVLTLCSFCILLKCGCSAAIAAPFINLDFQAANTNRSQIEERFIFQAGIPVGFYIFGSSPAADLLPGWTVIQDGHETNVVAIGNGYYGWPTPLSIPCYVALTIQGRYLDNYSPSAGKYDLLISCARAFGGEYRTTGVTQTAEVPADAKFLLMSGGGVKVTIDNQVVFFPRQNGYIYFDSYFRYYADISAFAGKTVTLGIYSADDIGGSVSSLEFIGSNSLRIEPSITKSTSGAFRFAWIGELATKYQVESTTNIIAGWQSIGTPVTSTNRIYVFSDTTVTNQPSRQRFYRLRSLP